MKLIRPTAVLLAAIAALAGCVEEESQPASNTSALSGTLLGSDVVRELPTREEAMSVAPGTLSSPDPGGRVDVDVETIGHDSGDPAAPVKVVEFSDFACGYCRKFHVETFPALEAEYIETGKVHWKYVPLLLGIFGPNADDAALAGECAIEQDRFAPVRDRLYRDQAEWKGARDPVPALRRIIDEEGLDVARWDRCMADGSRDVRIRQGAQLARQIGVRGTPTVILLGFGPIQGSLPLELYREVLDTIHAEVTRGRPGG